MKPLFALLLLVSFCFTAAAQSTKQQDKAAKQAAHSRKRAVARVRDSIALQTHSNGHISAKLNVFNLVDPDAPTIQPGIEVKISKRLSGEFAVGIPARIDKNVRNTDSTYNRYHKLRFELRFFPLKRRSFYVAPELIYISIERSRYNGKFETGKGDIYRYEFAEIEKSVYAAALKLGIIAPIRKNPHWYFDLFFGTGRRFINFKLNARNITPSVWFLDYGLETEGSSVKIHTTAGVKIGYVIF